MLLLKERSLLRVFYGMRQNKIALLSFIVIVLVAIIATFANVLAPYSPDRVALSHAFESPSFKHLLGTDELGRDILSRLMYGARVSLLVGASVVSASAVIGLLLGAIAGFYGGGIDMLIMRVVDVFLSFPGIILAVGLVAIIGPGIQNVIIALIAANWPGYTRVIRNETLKLRGKNYVVASKLSGASNSWIIRKHILSGVAPSVTVLSTIGFGWAVLAEAGISFLGLGVQPPQPSWGNMVAEGFQYFLTDPLMVVMPGLAIAATVWSFNMFGDYLRDLLIE